MSLLRTLTKPLRDAYEHRDELKEKAKDLPVTAFQAALSGVGHALLIGDRVRNAVQRLIAPEEKPAAPEETAPARREPVIFAPRPSAPTPEPAPKPEPVATAPTKEPVKEPEPATPEPKPEPVLAKPEPAEPKPEPVKPEPEPATPEPKPEPVLVKPEPAEPKPEPVEAKSVQAEPIPGYAELTVASLRARMRGRSVAQIQQLLDYEEATSGRPEVITMFRKRLTKLQSEA